MHYAIIDEKDSVISDGKSWELFPNVSFPDGIPTEDYLKSHNAVAISTDIEHDSTTQHLIPCNPYKKDGVWYGAEVVNMTSEEQKEHLNAHIDFEKISTDWTESSDANLTSEDKKAFKEYRESLEKARSAKNLKSANIGTRPEVKNAR